MAYTSPFQEGVALDDSTAQRTVDRIYNAVKARGLTNNTKPTFSEGDPVRASNINTVISKRSGTGN